MNVFALHLVTTASAPAQDQGPAAVWAQKSNDYQDRGYWKALSLTAEVFDSQWLNVLSFITIMTHSPRMENECNTVSTIVPEPIKISKVIFSVYKKMTSCWVNLGGGGRECTEKNKKDE